MLWKTADYAGWGRALTATGDIARPERRRALDALLQDGLVPGDRHAPQLRRRRAERRRPGDRHDPARPDARLRPEDRRARRRSRRAGGRDRRCLRAEGLAAGRDARHRLCHRRRLHRPGRARQEPPPRGLVLRACRLADAPDRQGHGRGLAREDARPVPRHRRRARPDRGDRLGAAEAPALQGRRDGRDRTPGRGLGRIPRAARRLRGDLYRRLDRRDRDRRRASAAASSRRARPAPALSRSG